MTDDGRTERELAAAVNIASAVVDVVVTGPPEGVPGGKIYAILMTKGMSLGSFESLMSLLVRSELVTKRGECYFPVT